MVAGLSLVCMTDQAQGKGTAAIMTSKSIPESTVAVIDPETGTSTGGASDDVKIAIDDIIVFRFNYTPVSKLSIQGIQAWLTEYVPPNTEVVGVRIIDQDGNTIPPRLPGLTVDGCVGAACATFGDVPCEDTLNPMSPTCTATDERDLLRGSISQVYADTGVYYTTDDRLARYPDNAFITLDNGYLMNPEPNNIGEVDEPVGAGTSIYAHNEWDLVQMYAYGAKNTAVCGNGGYGVTPYLFGSPVAGPDTWYPYEATDMDAATDLFDVRLNDTDGPWHKIEYIGSQIGSGTQAGSGSLERKSTEDTSTSLHKLSPANPLPFSPELTRAVRVALGEIRLGETGAVEIALRVKGTPLDPGYTADGGTDGADIDCGEIIGGDGSVDTSAASSNPWSFYLGSPACVYLNLLFDLTPSRPLVTTTETDPITYTLRIKNLSLKTQENVYVREKYTNADLGALLSTSHPLATGTAEGDSCTDDSTLYCLVWSLGDLEPSEEVTITTSFEPGGGSPGGAPTAVVFADFSSTALPLPGFETQATTVTEPTAVVRADLDHTPALVTGGTASFTGSVYNTEFATGNTTIEDFTLFLPTGFTIDTNDITIDPTPENPSDTFNDIICDADGQTTPTCSVGVAIDPDEAIGLSFGVDVAASAGIYKVDLQVWATDAEKYFMWIDEVAVGTARTDPPVIDCPISRVWTEITGTTTGGAGTDIRLFFNGVYFQNDGSSDGYVIGSGPDWVFEDFDTSFGELYYGLEVRATAQATGELESELSEPCIVGGVRGCADGLDNDSDGLVDFPNDPGCSSYYDETEDDPECWDGLDNDSDGDTDWPDDLECWGAYDDSEGGLPACSDGEDNDGDGATDFGSDTCCDSSSDRIEACPRACQDGADNDSDGLVDFPEDPGCHSLNDNDETYEAVSTTDIRARLLLLFDTSGSMNFNTCFSDPYDHDANSDTPPISPFTGGDGTVECPGDDYGCSTYPLCSPTGCGNLEADDARLYKAKVGISNAIDAYGEVQYGLMRFRQQQLPFSCPTINASAQAGGWQGSGGDCGETCDAVSDTCPAGTFNRGDLLVSFSRDNQYDMLEWLDGQSNYPGGAPPPGMDFELRGSGTTPLGGSLISARMYLQDVEAVDPVAGCRPYRVVLITDGKETCDGDPITAAGDLQAAGYDTYVIGFAITDGDAVSDLNDIASAGGTTEAIFVDDEAQLSATIADIVFETMLVEVCNGLDDDCDGLTDETFPEEGERCDTPFVDADSDGEWDPGLVADVISSTGCSLTGGNPCGDCSFGEIICDSGALACDGAVGPDSEVCDCADNDCDGDVDEGVDGVPCWQDDALTEGECTQGTTSCLACNLLCVGGIGPATEICDDLDNDCDGLTDAADGNMNDPRLGGACGTDTGECTAGSWQCVGGAVACSGTGPWTEVCDGADNNCDGVTDEVVQWCTLTLPDWPYNGGVCAPNERCGICRAGYELCVELPGPTYDFDGICHGQVLPSTEVCDGKDNDCDGMTDEDGVGDPLTRSCGSDVGACVSGTEDCVNGVWDGVCDGEVPPGTEVCDGIDNDCDGSIDESDPAQTIGDPCNGGQDLCDDGSTDTGDACGICQLGSWTCVDTGLVWEVQCVGIVPPSAPDNCNGLDDDCDGETDEDEPSRNCGSDLGNCSYGSEACQGADGVPAWGPCLGGTDASSEICDGEDNNCDGATDETFPDEGQDCNTSGLDLCDDGEAATDDACGICSLGIWQCVNGGPVCAGMITPQAEVCDGWDNDCDGDTDEDGSGATLTQECGTETGICTLGVETCVGVDGLEVWGACSGEAGTDEVCNGLDDDCDGYTDEEFPGQGDDCNDTGTDFCDDGSTDTGDACGECNLGTIGCPNGSPVCLGVEPPATEICDARDNDCDGETDESFDGMGDDCDSLDDADFCANGTLQCVCVGPSCQVSCQGDSNIDEVCDGEDNDCDGTTDETFPDEGQPCNESGQDLCDASTDPLVACGQCTVGFYQCVNATVICSGVTTPQGEICDGWDNDCDGYTDESELDPNEPMTRVCGTDTGECTQGLETCLGADGVEIWSACTGDAGTDETCNDLDDDCDGATDEEFPESVLNCRKLAPDDGWSDPDVDLCPGTADPTDDVCGVCSLGNWICDPGGVLRCVGAVGPAASDLCDGWDNDCDTATDEDELTQICGDDTGECETGLRDCLGQYGIPIWSDCQGQVEPVDELCDNLDNNCDGRTDEDNPEGGEECDLAGLLTEVMAVCQIEDEPDHFLPCGECQWGTTVCVELSEDPWAELQCLDTVGPVTEICDNKDNDCDGLTDADDAMSDDRLGGQCGSDVGECEGGNWVCSDDGEVICQIVQGPTPELCDGADNDCDGQTDEQTEVDQNEETIGLPCRDECPTENPDDCVDILTAVMEGPDGCSEADTDHPDDSLYDIPCGACRLGALACVQVDVGVAAVLCEGARGPDAEVCDGIDNDCDGLTDTDDPNIDDPDLGAPCPEYVTGECTRGLTTCADGEIVCEGGQGPVAEVCDGKDNDCDGVTDEGIPLGGACGTDVGECRPGTWACCTDEYMEDGLCEVVGEVVCLGGVEPINEICDGLDNDCDGDIDETEDISRFDDRLGQQCGRDVGECEMGVTQCIDADVICVGEVGPIREQCDCLDNDCDGDTDEDDDMCPEPAICVDCQCAMPCLPEEEFSESCPSGKSSKQFEDLGCYCVKEICTFDECSQQVIERNGETMCAPDSSRVGHCVCSGNECTFPCDGVSCNSGMICDPRDGVCRPQTCAIFGCEQGERCEAETGACEPDPCAEADCADNEACRDGDCFESCASKQCDSGQRCVSGECVEDRCAEVSCGRNELCNPDSGECADNQCIGETCPTGFVCNPFSGGCQPDPCLITTCPQGQTCQEGECIIRCGGGRIECEDRCVDPQTDRAFCGATDNCQGANAGVECPEGQVCSNGACSETCAENLIACAGGCVDPMSNPEYCGASDDCQGANAGNACSDGEVCVSGVCSFRCLRGQVKCDGQCIEPMSDSDWCGASGDCQGASAGRKCAEGETCANGICTTADGDTDEVEAVKHRAVSAAGGGCSCTVPAGAQAPGQERGRWVLLLGLFGLVALRLRRRSSLGFGRLASAPALKLLLAALLLAVAVSVSGCKVDPLCLDCQQPVDAGRSDSALGAADTGPRQNEAGPPAYVDAGQDAADARLPEGCIEYELCNGMDDDCDGDTDEDFDLNSNVNHCGSCEISCVRDHAFTQCNQGSCEMIDCDIAFVNLDRDEDNGCEYYCLKEAEEDTRCDLRDNDCDGEIDEDVDLESDPNNCGSCGFVCKFARAAEGGSCVDSECVLDNTRCDEGYHDIDGNDANGCEYECTADDPDDEVCDLKDNNCDGQVDEGDPGGGALCGGADGLGAEIGECRAGVETCMSGDIVCDGAVVPDTEVCDGLDNDCDGETDEDIAGVGPSFKCDGDDTDLCRDGNKQCRKVGDQYVIICVEQGVETLPLDDVEICDGEDNDCDGIRDEGNPGGGVPCNHVWDPDAGSDGGAWVPVDLCPGTDAGTDDVCGACSAGSWQCGFGGLFCDGTVVPQAVEICDGEDNDCDGVTDENAAGTGGACDGADSDKCLDGRWLCRKVGDDSKIVCVEDSSTGDQAPVNDVEVCDGLDNDCDTAVDEDYPDKGAPCNDTGMDLCDDGGTDTGDACGECSLGKMTCVEVTLDDYQVVCVGEEEPVTEICDGLDNDCDGMTDETAAGAPMTLPCGSSVGECEIGYRACTGANGRPSWSSTCYDQVVPAPESCNGRDDDCDGATDESYPEKNQPCNDSGVDLCDASTDPVVACGICKAGAVQCVNGGLVCPGEVLPAADDLCDGYDNDCDGNTDNGTPGDPTVLTRVCGKSVGECYTGTQTCDGANGAPSWTDCAGQYDGTGETCNGLDDDCDGATDETFPTKGDPCIAPYADLCLADGVTDLACGTCQTGTVVCGGASGTTCSGAVGPGTEVCDGLDNDCDGETDENMGQTTCGKGICVNTIDNCVGGAVQVCYPFQGQGTELCNSLDDDCDGATDETFPSKNQPCNDSGQDLCDASTDPVVACGICKAGKQQCVNGEIECPGEVLPAADDLCDGYDNDCDGYTDNADYGLPAPLTKVCGKDVGECYTGTQSCNGANGVPAWTACSGAYNGTTEDCNGLDDDCDGATDETYPGKGDPCIAPYADLCLDAVTDMACGTCRTGTVICEGVAGTACSGAIGPGTEVCDGKDNDCDGDTDENMGQTTCGLGECNHVINNCEDGVPQFCNPFDGASDEICDGLDNNCNGSIDETFPEIGQPCQHLWDAASDEWVEQDLCLNGATIDVCGTCSPGEWYCIGATLECLGIVWPGTESCNSQDDDCDALTDEDFNFSSVNSCGDCDTVCSRPNAYPSCNGVSCSYECWPGYVDDPTYDADSDGDPADGDDCSYECVPSGVEICNGQDDDCDMQTDEPGDMTEPDTSTFCRADGQCSGGFGEVTLICDGENGWQCVYDAVTDYEDPESSCDGLDNDCDGKTDEMYSYLGAACSEGQGGCRGDGIWQCVPGNPSASPECTAVEGSPQPEICNAVDDDCDGKVDEPCPDPTATEEGPGDSCVQDAWVQMAGGYYIYAYEAVRPDAGSRVFDDDAATDVESWSAGKSAARACSRAGWDDGALPWTNVTYEQAQTACLNAGARLCTAAEWTDTCELPDCYWCFADGMGAPAIDCQVYETDVCNGNDYDADPVAPGDQDMILPTGWLQYCYRDHSATGGSGQAYDMSGNVKEWVEGALSPVLNPLRGGALDNTDRGISCSFDFVQVGPQYFYTNAGFRCCWGS